MMFALVPEKVRAKYGPHDWQPSRLGHGHLLCRLCMGTIMEIQVIGDPNHCEKNKPGAAPDTGNTTEE